MGCMGSKKNKGPPPQTAKNTLKVLCLGVGGCGKTTFVKQMKIIHNIGFNEIELVNYKKIIRGNYVNGIQDCLEIGKKLGLAVKEENSAIANEINTLRARTVDLTPELLKKLKQIYSDPLVQEVLKEHSEQLTITHLSYFFDEIERITSEVYQPTPSDVLRCRQRTAGANSASVYIDKNYFEFFDIGGQKPERAKWEQILHENEFAAILYFVAADEFDVDDEEKEYERTKLEISKFIFSEMVNSNIIQEDVPVILFLNREDLFEKRLQDPDGLKSFKKHFPEYTGTADKSQGLDHIKQQFLSTLRDPDNSNPIRVHYTCALDTESMVVVWKVVREYLLKQALQDIGLLT